MKHQNPTLWGAIRGSTMLEGSFGRKNWIWTHVLNIAFQVCMGR
jgi:hypothetical protein